MKEWITKRVQQIPPSGIREFFELIKSVDDVVSLGVGEPDFSTPWTITEAAIYSLERGATSYTSNKGMPKLRQLIAEYLEREYGLNYDPEEELLITAGVSEALDIAIRAVAEPGDEVIVVEPCYVSYKPCVILAGAEPVILPTCFEDDFRIDIERLSSLISERTKALILSYPNNPTGVVQPVEILKQIVKMANECGFLLISDEIYSKLVYGQPHVRIASLPGGRDCTLLLDGFSKNYAMTGWRVGYAAGPKEVLAAMTKIHQYTMLCAPTPSQHAAIEALREGGDAAERMREEYKRRRNYIMDALSSMGMDFVKPEGAFYIFPKVEKFGLEAAQFCRHLLLEEKVAVVPGAVFGESGKAHIRISYASSFEQIEEAMERMCRFLERLKVYEVSSLYRPTDSRGNKG